MYLTASRNKSPLEEYVVLAGDESQGLASGDEMVHGLHIVSTRLRNPDPSRYASVGIRSSCYSQPA